MRFLLLRLVVPVIVIAAVWIFAGAAISAILDRFSTVAVPTTSATDMSIAEPANSTMVIDTMVIDTMVIDQRGLSFAGRRWLLGASCTVGTGASGEVTLASGGRTFSLPAVAAGDDPSSGAYTRVHPAPGDRVTFTTSRSRLAWPLLDRFSIMGAPRPSWQRHLYHRLHWQHPSGETLDIEWRDEQQFYAPSGWSDMFLENPPRVTIGLVSP